MLPANRTVNHKTLLMILAYYLLGKNPKFATVLVSALVLLFFLFTSLSKKYAYITYAKSEK